MVLAHPNHVLEITKKREKCAGGEEPHLTLIKKYSVDLL
jgi:hypothetical protein